MEWNPPTPSDFKMRFPIFEGVADATLQMILDEAVLRVGSTWIEKYRTPAVLYLTAHLLVSQGIGVLSAGYGGAAVTGAIKRRTVGDVTTEFVGKGGGDSSGDYYADYRTTEYGIQFLRLQRMCFAPIAVV